jgi:hypothetical protein
MPKNQYLFLFRMFRVFSSYISYQSCILSISVKKKLLIQLSLHKKEIEILTRQNRKGKLDIKKYDRTVFAAMNRDSDIKDPWD